MRSGVYQLLRQQQGLIDELAEMILKSHFPDTIHEEILNAVGLRPGLVWRATREPAFREKILRAYEFKCADCSFDVRIDQRTICLEAAHLR